MVDGTDLEDDLHTQEFRYLLQYDFVAKPLLLREWGSSTGGVELTTNADQCCYIFHILHLSQVALSFCPLPGLALLQLQFSLILHDCFAVFFHELNRKMALQVLTQTKHF